METRTTQMTTDQACTLAAVVDSAVKATPKGALPFIVHDNGDQQIHRGIVLGHLMEVTITRMTGEMTMEMIEEGIER